MAASCITHMGGAFAPRFGRLLAAIFALSGKNILTKTEHTFYNKFTEM